MKTRHRHLKSFWERAEDSLAVILEVALIIFIVFYVAPLVLNFVRDWWHAV